MLTRLEVDGFKNLVDFEVEFGPFTCIAGENGVGKSNVFDAIEFLSLLSSNPLMEAAHGVRSAGDRGSGDPLDLCWRGEPGERRVMRFAAEMIIPPRSKPRTTRASIGSSGSGNCRQHHHGRRQSDNLDHPARDAELAPSRSGAHLTAHHRPLLGPAAVDGQRSALRHGIELPVQALSEGTLRFLALTVLESDPDERGLICMEEPENGIYPANIKEMVDLLRDLAVDPDFAVDDVNPPRQVIVNTHSPALVQYVQEDELLRAASRHHRTGDGVPARVLELTPFINTWRADQSSISPITQLDLLPYLTVPVGAPISLDDYQLEPQLA